MKFIQIIALLYLISFTYQRCSAYSKQDECKTDNLDDYDKERGREYCCFVKNANNLDNKDGTCVGLTKYQYKHIKDYIKYQILTEGAHEDSTIDCKSFYLEISLLSLLLFLF